MSCHGFGGGKVTSEKAPEEDIKAIAYQISELKYMGKRVVEYAHAVIPQETAFGHYDIIFKFKELGKKGGAFAKYTHSLLVAHIKAIEVNGHSVSHVDLWIIPEEKELT